MASELIYDDFTGWPTTLFTATHDAWGDIPSGWGLFPTVEDDVDGANPTYGSYDFQQASGSLTVTKPGSQWGYSVLAPQEGGSPVYGDGWVEILARIQPGGGMQSERSHSFYVTQGLAGDVVDGGAGLGPTEDYLRIEVKNEAAFADVYCIFDDGSEALMGTGGDSTQNLTLIDGGTTGSCWIRIRYDSSDGMLRFKGWVGDETALDQEPAAWAFERAVVKPYPNPVGGISAYFDTAPIYHEAYVLTAEPPRKLAYADTVDQLLADLTVRVSALEAASIEPVFGDDFSGWDDASAVNVATNDYSALGSGWAYLPLKEEPAGSTVDRDLTVEPSSLGKRFFVLWDTFNGEPIVTPVDANGDPIYFTDDIEILARVYNLDRTEGVPSIVVAAELNDEPYPGTNPVIHSMLGVGPASGEVGFFRRERNATAEAEGYFDGLVPGNPDSMVWVRVRYNRMTEHVLKIKVWAGDYSTEPAAWDAEKTESSTAGGALSALGWKEPSLIGVTPRMYSASWTQWIDYFSYAEGADTAPGPGDPQSPIGSHPAS